MWQNTMRIARKASFKNTRTRRTTSTNSKTERKGGKRWNEGIVRKPNGVKTKAKERVGNKTQRRRSGDKLIITNVRQ